MTLPVVAAFLILAIISKHAFLHYLSLYSFLHSNKYYVFQIILCIDYFTISTVFFLLALGLFLLMRYRNYNLSPKHVYFPTFQKNLVTFFFTKYFVPTKAYSCCLVFLPHSCSFFFSTNFCIYILNSVFKVTCFIQLLLCLFIISLSLVLIIPSLPLVQNLLPATDSSLA